LARRNYEGNLAMPIRIDDLLASPEGIMVANPQYVDQEFREIYTQIEHADPSAEGQDGNFNAKVIPITTPSTVNTELAVAHGLDRTPVGCQVVMGTAAGQSWIGSLYMIRAADTQYLYVAVRAAADTSRSTSLRVW
jgi:hypothetical protein